MKGTKTVHPNGWVEIRYLNRRTGEHVMEMRRATPEELRAARAEPRS